MLSILSTLAATLVVMTLLPTGLLHAAQPYFFIHTITNYRILPASLAGVVGLLLPYFQITLGACLLLKIAERMALHLAMIVFASFAIAQFSVLARGIEIDCGCFGFMKTEVSATSVLVPLSLLITCFLAQSKPQGGGTKQSVVDSSTRSVAREG